jgi:hypothetical protein
MFGRGVTIVPPAGRGCGQRDPGFPYGCTGLSPFGSPWHTFVVDPVRLLPGGWQRGVQLLERADGSGKCDVLCFIGAEFYPSPWDFVVEARSYGVSRQFPVNFPWHRLTPYESRMLHVHALAGVTSEYLCSGDAPLKHCVFEPDNPLWGITDAGYHAHGRSEIEEGEGRIPCTFAHGQLAGLWPSTDKRQVTISEDGTAFTVRMASIVYAGKLPVLPSLPQKGDPLPVAGVAGIFFATYLTHFEVPRLNEAAPDVAEKAQENMEAMAKAGWDVVEMDG